MTEVQIKILRLNTGEDIIGACLDDQANGMIDIEHPMRVVVRRSPDLNKTVLLMSPWLPLELIEDDLASINYADIITVISPNQQFIEYYTNTVTEFVNKIRSDTEGDPFDVEEDEEDSDEPSSMEEILEAIKESKKGKLH